jgi:hypothetical protein
LPTKDTNETNGTGRRPIKEGLPTERTEYTKKRGMDLRKVGFDVLIEPEQILQEVTEAAED